MMKLGFIARRSRLIAVFAAVLLVAACANKNGAGGTGTGAAGGNATPGTAQDFVVNVGDRVFFTVDSSNLTSASQTTLSKQAQWLKRYSRYSITIEGHADERGTRQYNIALGARRAAAVRDYLVGLGINRSRVKTISYGKERPVAVCNDISCWSQNRRAVTVVNGAGS